MAYTKSHNPWISTDTITTTVMNNFETIYTESNSYLTTHVHDDLYETKTEMEAKYWYAGNDGAASGSDADGIYYGGVALHGTTLANYSVPMGLIVMWYGAIVDIPAGWSLCNGTGTPDLRNKFVVGVGSAYAVGATGGSATINPTGTLAIATHTLTTAEMGAHIHPFTDKTVTSWSADHWSTGSTLAGDPNDSSSGNTTSTGGAGAHGHSTAEGSHMDSTGASLLPYYYALAYIQKTS